MILLGMMASGSDECMLLTRFMDRDVFEIGAVRFGLQQFHNRINHLFLNKARLQTGYTKMALDFLENIIGFCRCPAMVSGLWALMLLATEAMCAKLSPEC